MDYILLVWLKTVPKYASVFCQLTIISLFFEAISGPLWMTVQATGRIKKYQIAISSILILNVPFAYLLLKYGFEPYYVLMVNICVGFLALVTRILFLRKLILLSAKQFIKKVLLPIFIITILSIPLPIMTNFYIHSKLLNFIISSGVSFFSVVIFVCFIGLNQKEQLFLKNKLSIILKNTKKIL
jgi:hypothetical protein